MKPKNLLLGQMFRMLSLMPQGAWHSRGPSQGILRSFMMTSIIRCSLKVKGSSWVWWALKQASQSTGINSVSFFQSSFDTRKLPKEFWRRYLFLCRFSLIRIFGRRICRSLLCQGLSSPKKFQGCTNTEHPKMLQHFYPQSPPKEGCI